LCAEQHHHHDTRLDLTLKFDYPLVVSRTLELRVAPVNDLGPESGERRVSVLDDHQLVVVVEEERIAGLGRIVDGGGLGLHFADLDLRKADRRPRISRIVLRRRREHLDHVVERAQAGHQVADFFPVSQHGRKMKRFGRDRSPSRRQHKDNSRDEAKPDRKTLTHGGCRDSRSASVEREAHAICFSHFWRWFNRIVEGELEEALEREHRGRARNPSSPPAPQRPLAISPPSDISYDISRVIPGGSL
jgi:hypothetical protein